MLKNKLYLLKKPIKQKNYASREQASQTSYIFLSPIMDNAENCAYKGE